VDVISNFFDFQHTIILEGSDWGLFMDGRHGFYVKPLNIWVVFILLRGNNIHQGTVTSYDPVAKLKWIETKQLEVAWRLARPENRIFFVQYYALVACLRMSSMSISRPVHFGNQGTEAPHKAQQKTFCDDGQWLMGNEEARANRLGREFAFQFFNSLQQGKLKLNCSMAQLLNLISFDDEHGDAKRLLPPDFDVVLDRQHVEQWRSWYAWHRQQSARHYIRITKEDRASVQAWLKLRYTDTISFPLTERRPIVTKFMQEFSNPPKHVVQSVLERHLIAGKVRVGQRITVYILFAHDAN
jgi:hypothetical protein